MNKKGFAGTVLIIIIIVLFLGWLINEGWKECRNDSDCSQGQYCGSDFSCHDFQVVMVEQPAPFSFSLGAAFILGLSLIIAALIMKWDTIFRKKKTKEELEEEKKLKEQQEKSHSRKAEPSDAVVEDWEEQNS